MIAESEFGGTKPIPPNSSSENPKTVFVMIAESEFGGTMNYRSKEIFPFWINSSPSGQRTRI